LTDKRFGDSALARSGVILAGSGAPNPPSRTEALPMQRAGSVGRPPLSDRMESSSGGPDASRWLAERTAGEDELT
jgi:hypothetical protein